MIEIRCYSDEDYPQIAEWYEGHGMLPVHKDLISTFGLIACQGGLDLACGWIYLSNSKVATIEWLVSNPYAEAALRGVAIKQLIIFGLKEIIAMDRRFVFTPVEHQSLLRWYKRLGFTPNRSNLTIMGLDLWGLKPQ